ncbi:hypothetical protein L6452_18795 [Arctium lappa]|uniref:Uncharacterized protein n=1 Tax=Arctium lappa TaxID=4217 RepID=A0ACB9C7A5_ARCLA|nr:hypothetical protein L6452_18795 [Arctium lappa]
MEVSSEAMRKEKKTKKLPNIPRDRFRLSTIFIGTVQVLKKNDAGDHFLLLAICLGFELLTMIISKFMKNADIEETYFQRADDNSMSLGAATTVCRIVIGAMAGVDVFSSIYFSSWSNKSYFKPLVFSNIVLLVGNAMSKGQLIGARYGLGDCDRVSLSRPLYLELGEAGDCACDCDKVLKIRLVESNFFKEAHLGKI